jgi:hypothetical protein
MVHFRTFVKIEYRKELNKNESIHLIVYHTLILTKSGAKIISLLHFQKQNKKRLRLYS